VHSTGGVRGTLAEFVQNDRQHAIQIRQHVVIPKPQYIELICRKPAIPARIGTRFRVLSAINLDHHAGDEANKIRNERTDRHLPSEFELREASVS
jgi:hypothetical protein